MIDRLHPQTMETVRQLIKLHGASALIEAVQQIERRQKLVDGLRDRVSAKRAAEATVETERATRAQYDAFSSRPVKK
jgi:hypothetical protein